MHVVAANIFLIKFLMISKRKMESIEYSIYNVVFLIIVMCSKCQSNPCNYIHTIGFLYQGLLSLTGSCFFTIKSFCTVSGRSRDGFE